MGKKFYEIGLCVKASEYEHDYETVEWEDDFESVTEARKRAKELSKTCPFKYRGLPQADDIVAIQITCHSDEEDVSSYYLHWCETYVNGKMVRRIDY